MKNLFIIAILISVIAVAGCVDQEKQKIIASQETEPAEQPGAEVQQPPEQTTTSENILGVSDSYYISAKKFSGAVDNIAQGKYSDACLISALGQYLDSTGKASLWMYKYYSKSNNKAVTITVQTKLQASGTQVYATTQGTAVFREEPYKKCVILLNDVDSTVAAKALSKPLGGSDTISIENNVDNFKDEYEFFYGATSSVKVDAVSGKLV